MVKTEIMDIMSESHPDRFSLSLFLDILFFSERARSDWKEVQTAQWSEFSITLFDFFPGPLNLLIFLVILFNFFPDGWIIWFFHLFNWCPFSQIAECFNLHILPFFPDSWMFYFSLWFFILHCIFNFIFCFSPDGWVFW